jgi:conjugal transfer/entry exclusion protein
MKQAMPVFEKNLIPAEQVDMRLIKQIAQIAGAENQLTSMLRNTVGAEYQRLQDEGRLINQIKSPQEQEKALRIHAEKLQKLFSKMR